MCFRFDPLSKAFSNYLFPKPVRSEMTPVLMHFDENVQLIIVDGRPERIEKYEFSIETALVMMGPVSRSAHPLTWCFVQGLAANFPSTERWIFSYLQKISL